MAIKLQLRTLRRNVVRRHRKVGRGPRGGRFTFRKREHQARHSQFAHYTGSAAGPLAWSEIDPAHRAFDARGPTKPNFQRPDRAGQRCNCRLVCEWVGTVTSVSVRTEKRANCAKNIKPKSGGLYLVNSRIPEHSSSRATFSAGIRRAWLEDGDDPPLPPPFFIPLFHSTPYKTQRATWQAKEVGVAKCTVYQQEYSSFSSYQVHVRKQSLYVFNALLRKSRPGYKEWSILTCEFPSPALELPCKDGKKKKLRKMPFLKPDVDPGRSTWQSRKCDRMHATCRSTV